MFANNINKGVIFYREIQLKMSRNTYNISSTMREMEVNTTVLFPNTIEWSSIRSIAGRFNSAGASTFSVKKVEGGYEVTRTK